MNDFVPAAAADPKVDFTRGGKWQASDAVSYTHLRAHETGLDLVCRLLLEKKNTHTS